MTRETASTTMGRLDGSFHVRPSTATNPGRITVTHVNHNGGGNDDGNEVDDSTSDDDEQLYTAPLGALVYENGDTEIAYQGGGVWRKQSDGATRMVSPPEFHYRRGTLTLPVIQTGGSGDVGGQVFASTKKAAGTIRKFPDGGTAYADDGSKPYQNSLSDGYVIVTVESRYYEGWADYFRSRTDGTVTVDDANEKVELKLETLGLTGDFQMPGDPSNGGGSLEIQGMDSGHALTDLTFRIYPKDDQESAFKNLRWSMYADSGNQKFEMAMKASGSSGCGDTVDFSIYYSDDGHSTYDGWNGAETVECSDVDGDGNDEYYIDVDLVDGTAGPNLDYASLSGSQLAHFKNEIGSATFQDPATLPGHGAGDHSDITYDSNGGDGTYPSVEGEDFVVSHYFSELGPDFELQVEDQQGGGGAGVDEDSSEGYIDYDGGGQVVTYLHISENRIEIDLR